MVYKSEATQQIYCVHEIESGILWQDRMKKTKANTNETKTISEQQLKKENYGEIMNIITSNESAAKETPAVAKV